jgi:hypothetical protein
MELGDSLPRSQKKKTTPVHYPELVHNLTHDLFKIRFNIVLSYTPSCSDLCLSLKFSDQNCMYISLFPTRSTHHKNLIILDFIPLKMLDEKYKLLIFAHNKINCALLSLFCPVVC